MKYITVKELASRWNISERRIIKLCNSGRINGAYKNGMTWIIPEDVKKLVDGRTKYSKSLPLKKTIVIAGINSEIGLFLTKILLENSYKVIGLYQKDSSISDELKQLNLKLIEIDYFDRDNLINVCNNINEDLAGFVFMEIFFNLEDTMAFDYSAFEDSYRVNVFAMNLLVRELVKKMNHDSSIVIVNSIEALRGSFGASAYASAQAAKANLVQTFANVFTEMYGVRINSVMAGWIGGVMENDDAFNMAKTTIPMKRLGSPEEIADDIFLMLTRHKYTTGSSLISDGGYLAVDSQSKTEDLSNGKYYRLLGKFFEEAQVGTIIWGASIMLPVEWTNDPLEVKFRQQNIDVVNRGAKMQRLFVFDAIDIPKYRKGHPFLEMILSTDKIEAWFVDKAKVMEEHPELISMLGSGFGGFDDYVLLVDTPPHDDVRGYATFNKKEISKMKDCFQQLKKFGVPLKDVLK